MNKRTIDKTIKSEDHFGNNIAVTCPRPDCQKVYIASSFLKEEGHPKGCRICPSCRKSRSFVSKDEAYVEWSN